MASGFFVQPARSLACRPPGDLGRLWSDRLCHLRSCGIRSDNRLTFAVVNLSLFKATSPPKLTRSTVLVSASIIILLRLRKLKSEEFKRLNIELKSIIFNQSCKIDSNLFSQWVKECDVLYCTVLYFSKYFVKHSSWLCNTDIIWTHSTLQGAASTIF